MKYSTVPTAAILLLSMAAACEERAAPPKPAAQRPGPPAAAPAGAPETAPSVAPSTPAPSGAEHAIAVAGVLFPLPRGWKQVPPSNAMRLAEVQVPAPSGDPTQAPVVAFSTAGGNVQANITRWAGQVRDASGQPSNPTVETKTTHGLKVHLVELTGTYVGMGEAPRAGWVLRGAVIEAPAGLVFVKMTGPTEGMSAAAAGFASMIDGLTTRSPVPPGIP